MSGISLTLLRDSAAVWMSGFNSEFISAKKKISHLFIIHTHPHACPQVCWRTLTGVPLFVFCFLFSAKMPRGKALSS